MLAKKPSKIQARFEFRNLGKVSNNHKSKFYKHFGFTKYLLQLFVSFLVKFLCSYIRNRILKITATESILSSDLTPFFSKI